MLYQLLPLYFHKYIYIHSNFEDNGWLLDLGGNVNQFTRKGLTSAGKLWILKGNGSLEIYNIETRNLEHQLSFDGYYKGEMHSVITSKDEKHLFIRFISLKMNSSSFYVVHIETGKVIAEITDLPRTGGNGGIFQQDSQNVILPVACFSTSPRKFGLMKLNWKTAVSEIQMIEDHAQSNGIFMNRGFFSQSPNQKYWLRYNASNLPITSLTEGGHAYGISVQLWEAFPFKFLKTIPVYWMTEEELPDATHLDFKRTQNGEKPKRHILYKLISAALDDQKPGPTESIVREACRSELQEDEGWKFVTENFQKLSCAVGFWENDSNGFWSIRDGKVTFVDLDGNLSERLFVNKKSIILDNRNKQYSGGYGTPSMATSFDLHAGSNRTAKVRFASGESAEIYAPISLHPHKVSPANEEKLNWNDGTIQKKLVTQLHRVIEVLEEEKRR